MKKGKDLERIITAVETSLSTQARIVPDYRVKDKESGKLRQIDIAVFIKESYRDYFCMIEVKDQKRRLGIGEVDKIKSIRNSVNANKAIIVSRSGFTESALKKAKINSIETLMFKDIDMVNWFEWIKFDHIDFLRWEVLYYRNASISLDIPLEIIKSLGFKLEMSEFRKKIFINPKNKKKLSLSNLTVGCLVQNPQLSQDIPSDGTIVTRIIPIKIADGLSLITDHGEFPVLSIIIEIDLKLNMQKLPIKAHEYRDVGEDKTIAEVITTVLPSSFGKKKMTITVPGKGKIGGRAISVKVHDIEEDNS